MRSLISGWYSPSLFAPPLPRPMSQGLVMRTRGSEGFSFCSPAALSSTTGLDGHGWGGDVHRASGDLRGESRGRVRGSRGPAMACKEEGDETPLRTFQLGDGGSFLRVLGLAPLFFVFVSGKPEVRRDR
jgi:hypothetical protein